MRIRTKLWITVAAWAVGVAFWSGAAAAASSLYTLNVSGPGNLLLVDPLTGATTPVAPDLSLGAGSWNGLASWPSSSGVLFAVNNPRPATLDDPQFSRLSRIDLETGMATLFPLFDPDRLGSAEIFSSALAISPLDPNVAVVAGFDGEFPPNNLMFHVDVTTGEVVRSVMEIADASRIEALTFGPDGTTLYGTDDEGRLITLDPVTAELTLVGDPELTDFVTGLAFRPEDGSLFAIDGSREDRLVVLDPLTGMVLDERGRLGIPGPEGLAFVVPEPSSAIAMCWGILGAMMIGRRWGSSMIVIDGSLAAERIAAEPRQHVAVGVSRRNKEKCGV